MLVLHRSLEPAGHIGPRQPWQTLQKDPDIELLSCPYCLGLSASQMPRREVLDAIYASYYDDHGGDAGVIVQNPSRLARHIVAMSEPIVCRNGEFRIVDFGGGSGAIALAVGNLVADRTCRSVLVQVIDYGDAPKSREGAVEMHFFRDLSVAATQCDLVIRAALWNMFLIWRWYYRRSLASYVRADYFMRALHTFYH
jgi:hypothetical protein